MKTVFFFFVSLGFFKAEACPFEGMSIGGVDDSSDFISSESKWAPFPEPLYLKYESRLGGLPLNECKESVIANSIQVKKTGKIYTAFYTNDDSCDGGNSYGMIIEGTDPRVDKVIATIEDSDIVCVQ
jgi:hypothetical protein